MKSFRTICVLNNFGGIGWRMKVDRITSNQGFEYRFLLAVGAMLNANTHQPRRIRIPRVVMNLAMVEGEMRKCQWDQTVHHAFELR